MARAKREKHAGGMFRRPRSYRPCKKMLFYFSIFCTLCYSIAHQ